MHALTTEKLTATKIAFRFKDAPYWWEPSGGQSIGSMRWNCERYTKFLEAKGFSIVESGAAKGSPWWIVESKAGVS